MLLKADIKYQNNCIDFGPNYDPHHNTEKAGKHAGIYLKKGEVEIFLRTRAGEYSEAAVELMQELVSAYYEHFKN